MVKNEMFGTRPSILYPHLEELEGFSILRRFWFVTCVRYINRDVKTRYLLIKECETRDELQTTDLSIIRPYFRDYIDMWVVFINNDEVYLKKERGSIKVMNSEGLKERLLTATECKYLPSFGMTSKEASPFSQFFRTNMGKGFSLTNVDFMIHVEENGKLIILEEKTFISNGFGLLGYGQYLSFGEIYHDALKNKRLENNIKWYIAFIDRDIDNIYLYDAASKNFPDRPSKYFHQWGKMVEIPLEEMKKILLKDIIKWIRGVAYE